MIRYWLYRERLQTLRSVERKLPGIGCVDSTLPIDKRLKKTGGKQEVTSSSSGSDKVSISESAHKMAKVSKYVDLVKKAPEPDAKKIEDITKRVQDNTYFDTVSADDIVDSLLSNQ